MPSSIFRTCMRCNRGGNVLVCTTDHCPNVIHERCIPAHFDEAGDFYCPDCLLSKDYIEVKRARENVKLKKRALLEFIASLQKQRAISVTQSVKNSNQEASSSNDVDSVHNLQSSKKSNVAAKGNVVGRTDEIQADGRVEVKQESANLRGPPSVQEMSFGGEMADSNENEDEANSYKLRKVDSPSESSSFSNGDCSRIIGGHY